MVHLGDEKQPRTLYVVVSAIADVGILGSAPVTHHCITTHALSQIPPAARIL